MTGGPGEVHAAQSLKQNLEVPFGWFPQPVYFATIMRRHMIEFGTTPEQFAAVAVACRRHANLQPGRRDARPADDDRRLSRVAVPRRPAAPLRLVPHLRRRGRVRHDLAWNGRATCPQPPAVVAGVGEGFSASGTHWAEQREFTSTPQVFSAPGAFAMAGIRPEDVDVLTVYDPFTVVSLMQIEDMGFCAEGRSRARSWRARRLHHDAGRLPFNTHGGLLSHAYVLGIAHVVECVKQLRGTAAAQVPDCEVAVYGGYTGHMASTLVLTKDA